jgi:exopolyphosphatase/guanosine-5'-triphosphate,3'-diphosphate pyrophosphatase
MNPRILSAIDIGTNSFHMIVAQVKNHGAFSILSRDKDVVRLGKSSTDMKYISADAAFRGINTLRRFKMICDSYDSRIRAVATSAVREALNRDDFIWEVLEKTGIKIEVISGFEEARLIYLGMLQALPVFNERILLIDIGGGSTEFLVGEAGEVLYANSIKVGTVRLSERFFADGKFTPDCIAEAKMFTRSAINPVIRNLSEYKFSKVIGTSGTITNIGSMIYSHKSYNEEDEVNFNNYTFGRESLEPIIRKIYKCNSVSKIELLPGLDSKRADIITAGTVILEQIFNELNLNKMTVSGYALREGIILDTIDKMTGERNLGVISDIRYKSVLSLAAHCNYDELHANQVLKFCAKLFDYISAEMPEFNLDNSDMEYLEAAALLHDIGTHISHSQHHRHSYYLIRNSEMLGYNVEELEIIANIARYHRKSHPKIKHENFSRLSAMNKDRVRKLSAILRVADGLDRSHGANVQDISFEKSDGTLNIYIIAGNGRDVGLEIWGANTRKELFEETYNLKLNIV